MNKLQFTLKGQCKSGKNAVMITRTGRRYPQKPFVEWRAKMFEQLDAQEIPKLLLDKPLSCVVTYYAQDKRRRDVPGMIDALWHIFEKYEIVADDKYIGDFGTSVTFISMGKDKDNARVEIEMSWE